MNEEISPEEQAFNRDRNRHQRRTFTTKAEVYKTIFMSLVLHGKPIKIPFEYLRFPFGFKRQSGESILLTQMIFPSRSEEEIQTDPDWIIEQSIESWCKERKILGNRDWQSPFGEWIFFSMEINGTSEEIHKLLS